MTDKVSYASHPASTRSVHSQDKASSFSTRASTSFVDHNGNTHLQPLRPIESDRSIETAKGDPQSDSGTSPSSSASLAVCLFNASNASSMLTPIKVDNGFSKPLTTASDVGLPELIPIEADDLSEDDSAYDLVETQRLWEEIKSGQGPNPYTNLRRTTWFCRGHKIMRTEQGFRIEISGGVDGIGRAF